VRDLREHLVPGLGQPVQRRAVGVGRIARTPTPDRVWTVRLAATVAVAVTGIAAVILTGRIGFVEQIVDHVTVGGVTVDDARPDQPGLRLKDVSAGPLGRMWP